MIKQKKFWILVVLIFLFVIFQKKQLDLFPLAIQTAQETLVSTTPTITLETSATSITPAVNPVEEVKIEGICVESKKATSLTTFAKTQLDLFFEDAKKVNEKVIYELAWENKHYQSQQNEIFIVSKRMEDQNQIETKLYVEDKEEYPLAASELDAKRFADLVKSKQVKTIYFDHVYSLRRKFSTVDLNEVNGVIKEFALQNQQVKIHCNQLENRFDCDCQKLTN